MTFISYSQNFEDVILWRALKHVERGFYIDVGANDPTTDSVTKAFYERGWHGINIEPLQAHFDDLVQERPNDINLRYAIGASRGETEIWECGVRGWATVSGSVIEQHRAEGYDGVFQKIPMLTLAEVCDEYVTNEIHFLKIDVEGSEKAVLEGMNFTIFRPWLVIVEATQPNNNIEVHQEWEELLLNSKYLLAYMDGLNRFYLAEEHVELLPQLRYPPNVFDSFKRVEQLHSEIRAQSAESRAQQAESAAQSAESRAQQAESAAQSAESRAQQAESAAKSADSRAQQLAAELQGVYTCRSWRITKPLRWLGRQARLLRQQGVVARIKAILRNLAWPIIHKVILYISLHPGLRLKCINLARRFGLYNTLYSLYRSFFVQGNPVNSYGAIDQACESTVLLTPHARQIYYELKAAIEKNKGAL